MPIRPLLISVLLTASLLGTPAHALQKYFGGNLARLDRETDTNEVDGIGLYGKMGFSDKRGIFRGELRLGVIDGDGDATVTGAVDVAGKLEKSGTLMGAYALVGMPAESTVRPYAFLGYSITDWTDELCITTESAGRECVDVDVDSISYGFGVDFKLGNDWIINVEYGIYLDDTTNAPAGGSGLQIEGSDFELSGISVGISVPFGGS